MAAQTFRSAFNGFNREDVIHHLEYVNTKYTNELNQLKLENDALRSEMGLLRSRPAAEAAPDPAAQEAMAAENDALRRQVEELKALLAEAQAKCAEAPEAPAAAAAPTSDELELYRRAERVEREARERANQVCHQANGALADATAKVDEAAAQIDEMADKVASQLTELQTLVSGSKQVLREALSAIGTIRPEE